MNATPTPPFGSVLTAILTPFDKTGAVDYEVFWRLVRHLLENGSDGVVVAGTTGEAPTLSKVEKVALFKTAVEAAAGKGLVIAGTGTYDTAESVEMTQRAAEAGCDGAMAVTPYYSKPPQEGIFQHFSAIADATDLPILVYNIPGRTARLIDTDTMARLADHPRIVAIKDATEDLEYAERQFESIDGQAAVYSGADGFTLDLLRLGSVGVVSVASHLVGNEIRAMIEAFVSGDEAEAQRLDAAMEDVVAALFLEPNPMGLKAAMTSLWGDVGDPRLPLVPASGQTLHKIEVGVRKVVGS